MTEESTARRRELGRELRMLRESRDMSGHEVARQTGWPPSNISRWENGLREIDKVEAAIYLATCGLIGPERDRLLEMTEPTSDLFWVRPYYDKLRDGLKSVILQESLAGSIVTYHPFLIPGLHQSRGYARALFEDVGVIPDDRIEFHVDVRMDRQRVLHKRNPPTDVIFVHEQALRGCYGGPRVMHEQIVQLLLTTSVPHCSLRVVPSSAGPHGALGGPFDVLEFEDHPAVVHADTLAAAVFIDDRPAVETYYTAITRLQRMALSVSQSREWLMALAQEYERMGD